MAATAMVIGGEPVRSGCTSEVEDPATEEAFDEVAVCTPDLVDRAVRAAQGAFRPWASLDLAERAERLRACGRALATAAGEVAELLTREQGKPLGESRAEVALAADWFGHTAGLDLPDELVVDDDRVRVGVERVPFGVVAAVTPSNYPVILGTCKIAPALLAGNCVVLKPSPDTPLATLARAAALQPCLPPGVLNVVAGGADVAAALVGHPDVRRVSFTGSVEAGRAVARAAGDGLKGVTLELGGNDAAVVLPGTPVDSVAAPLFGAAMANAGQFCAAVKRIYVARDQHDELVEALSALAAAAVVGPGLAPRTQIGPLTTRRQRERVRDLVEQARAGGARTSVRAQVPERGHFYPPTIVSLLPGGCALELEEQFGPALPVIAYDHPDLAVDRANGTRYALGASVWGEPARAAELSARLTAGTVWINTHGELRHDTPFGGAKWSGIGVEYGRWGLLDLTQVRVVHLRRSR